MGLGYPKQFLEYQEKPIFIHTLEVIESCNLVDEIIVVTNLEYIEEVKSQCKKYKITKLTHVVPGGKERQDSIYNALNYVTGAVIGVQDGVRPFIEERYVEESYLKIISGWDGVVVGVPVKDTIKQINLITNEIVDTPNRATLLAAQTPQVFKYEILRKAYDMAKKELFVGTDDSSLVERIGGKVGLVLGSYKNIKITTPEDLKFLMGKEKKGVER